MKKASFDAKNTYIQSPLRLTLFMCRHLLEQGYGTLRFCSYMNEGLGELRVAMYFEMKERGRNGERLALDPILLSSYSGFDRPSWPNRVSKLVERGYSVFDAATEFTNSYGELFARWQSPADLIYLDWFDKVIAICHHDGFPITGSPQSSSCGHEEQFTYFVFASDGKKHSPIARPPGFDSTVFPYNEYGHFLEEAARTREEARRKMNYAEWNRRATEIQSKTKQDTQGTGNAAVVDVAVRGGVPLPDQQ